MYRWTSRMWINENKYENCMIVYMFQIKIYWIHEIYNALEKSRQIRYDLNVECTECSSFILLLCLLGTNSTCTYSTLNNSVTNLLLYLFFFSSFSGVIFGTPTFSLFDFVRFDWQQNEKKCFYFGIFWTNYLDLVETNIKREFPPFRME